MHQVHFSAYDLDSRPRGRRAAGVIQFAPEMVRLEKVAGGALLSLGYTVHLNPGLCVSISNITGELHFHSAHPPSIAVGIAVDPEVHVIYSGYRFPTARRNRGSRDACGCP